MAVETLDPFPCSMFLSRQLYDKFVLPPWNHFTDTGPLLRSKLNSGPTLVHQSSRVDHPKPHRKKRTKHAFRTRKHVHFLNQSIERIEVSYFGSTFTIFTITFTGNLRKSFSITYWCNNHLEKYEFVNGKDDIPYTK